MKILTYQKTNATVRIALAVAAALSAPHASADTVTDWNQYTLLATKGASSLTTGNASIALNSNVATRIDAIEARVVFDALNAVNRFSPKSYYYTGSASPGSLTAKSASAAVAQAAYDVLLGTLPEVAAWNPTRSWLQLQLQGDLTGVDANDPGIAIGHEAAAAALAWRPEPTIIRRSEPRIRLRPT